MPALTINGIELAISADNVSQEVVEIGERGRTFDGSAYSSVRGRKQKHACKTSPMTVADARAHEGLLNGDGYNWDFESSSPTHLYSHQGLVFTVTGTVTRSTTYYKFGAASLKGAAGTGNYVTAPVGAYSSYTVATWVKTAAGGAWTHNVTRVASGATARWVNGVRDDTVTNWLSSYTGGVLKLFAYASDDIYLDDVVFLPYAVPDSWPAQMHAFGAALPALPSLTVNGDLLGSVAMTAQGRAVGSSPISGVVGGAWTVGARELSFDLEEV